LGGGPGLTRGGPGPDTGCGQGKGRAAPREPRRRLPPVNWQRRDIGPRRRVPGPTGHAKLRRPTRPLRGGRWPGHLAMRRQDRDKKASSGLEPETASLLADQACSDRPGHTSHHVMQRQTRGPTAQDRTYGFGHKLSLCPKSGSYFRMKIHGKVY